ncbi:unnamed protein product [Effrenium voratum]|nr:unnamed protein product [Effrenium voratum]
MPLTTSQCPWPSECIQGTLQETVYVDHILVTTGIFPSSGALRSQSSGNLQKLFFASTSESMHSGRQLTQEDQNENLSEVVNVGHRNTKYMKFQYSKAPLPGRGACRYTQDHSLHPVGDNVINSNFAASMKAKPLVALPAYTKGTLHADSWRTFSHGEMHDSKPGLAFYSMGKTNTLKEIGARMDTLSHAQRKHHGRSEDFCRPESAPPGIDNLYLHGRGGALGSSLRAGDCYSTSNQSQFWDFRFSAERPMTSSGD